MILSVSRRTDIPRFYYDWFLGRLREGYVLVRNPMNHRQVSRVALSEETIDCIAFWTKNPEPMLGRLSELEPYPYFIQFTLNAYGHDIESSLPKKEELLSTFQRLSETIGQERMIWRYSPILLSETYDAAHHLKYFETLAKRLAGYTSVCRISFLDMYRKIAPRMRSMGIREATEEEKRRMTKALIEIGSAYGISLGGCGNLNLQAVGLQKVGCIDADIVSRITGKTLAQKHDPGQRDTCYCAPSVDIGAYNTCPNGCVYCYANLSFESACKQSGGCDPTSPMLCDQLHPGDVVTERKLKSILDGQQRMFGVN